MLPARFYGSSGTSGLLDVFEELNRDLSRLAGRLFAPISEDEWVPYGVEISEDDKNVYVEVELPGVKSEDLDVTLEGGILTIRGEKREEHEDDKRQYHLRERRYSKFVRSFRLPATVDESKVSAELKDGVLHVTIEKRPEAQPRKIPVRGS